MDKEKFSKTLIGLTSQKKRSLLDLAGKWHGGSEEAKRIFDVVLKERHTFTKMRKFEEIC